MQPPPFEIAKNKLFNFRFVEYNVLTSNRVVFTEGELLSLLLRVLLFYIEIARVSRADEFN